MLKIYADESCRDGAVTLCGYVESPEYWIKFESEWADVLKKHDAPYFHFREFGDRHNKYKIKGNPFLSWSTEKRDNFIYDLAVVAGQSAVPVGGSLNIEKQKNIGLGDGYERVVKAFYWDVHTAIKEHWPDFGGSVSFVFDESHDDKWAAPLARAHDEMRQ